MPLIDRPNEDYAQKAFDNRYYIRLYDPPVDGKTPADGQGLPATSVLIQRDREAKIAQGFTREVVGWPDDAWPVLGDDINPNLYPFARRDHIIAEREQEKGIVAGKAARTRTIKR